MSFQFINNQSIGQRERLAIRSHVMKGKNTRKTRATKSIQKSHPQTSKPNSTPEGTSQSSDGQLRDPSPPPMPMVPFVGHAMSTLTFPVESTPYIRCLIHQFMGVIGEALYPSELCKPTTAMKSAWFQFLLVDQAFFHCTLAISARCTNFFLGLNDESPEAIDHLSRAMSLMNERLSGDEALSYLTLTLTATLTVYESIRRDMDRYRIHLDGLERMVNLRGGISAQGSPVSLIQKICRADIGFSLLSGSPPRFQYDQLPQHFHYLHTGDEIDSWTQSPLVHVFADSPVELLSLVRDILSTTSLFNDMPLFPKAEPHHFQGIVVSFGYRLLSADYSTMTNKLEHACHTGLVAFFTTLLLQFGRCRRLRYDRLQHQFKSAIQDISDDTTAEGSVYLWMLLVGGVSVFDEDDRAWLLPEVALASKRLGISRWEECRQNLTQFPWINSLHDMIGKSIWHRAMGVQYRP